MLQLQALHMHTLEMLHYLKIPLSSGKRQVGGRGGGSIGAHVLEATEHLSWPTHSVEGLVGEYSIHDAIWGGTNQCGVSVDTTKSEEVIVETHITEQHTFQFGGSV